MKSIITRPYKSGDDLHRIIDLIIQTDAYIYPPMFVGHAQDCYSFFTDCLNDRESFFYHENLLVAECDGDIAGVLFFFRGGEQRRLCDPAWISAYESAVSIMYCNTHYFIPLMEEYIDRASTLYISNICVAESLRNHGIAGRLLSHLITVTQDDMELDVLCDNPAAIHLYEKYGFRILSRDPAFSFYPTDTLYSYKMARCARKS